MGTSRQAAPQVRIAQRRRLLANAGEHGTGLRLHRGHQTTSKQLCCCTVKHVHAPTTHACGLLQVTSVTPLMERNPRWCAPAHA